MSYKMTEAREMKIMYGYFMSGLGHGQFLHTETGVTIIEDQVDAKYIYAQFVKGEPWGPVGKKLYNKVLKAQVEIGKSIDLAENETKYPLDEFKYTVKNILVSAAVSGGLEKVTQHSIEKKKPLTPTTQDESWVRELLSMFPQFETHNIEFKPSN